MGSEKGIQMQMQNNNLSRPPSLRRAAEFFKAMALNPNLTSLPSPRRSLRRPSAGSTTLRSGSRSPRISTTSMSLKSLGSRNSLKSPKGASRLANAGAAILGQTFDVPEPPSPQLDQEEPEDFPMMQPSMETIEPIKEVKKARECFKVLGRRAKINIDRMDSIVTHERQLVPVDNEEEKLAQIREAEEERQSKLFLKIEHSDKRSRLRSSSACKRAHYEHQASSGTIDNIHDMNKTYTSAC